MKKIFYSLLIATLMINTAFAVNTDPDQVSYEIDEDYQLYVDFYDGVDTDEYLRVKVTSQQISSLGVMRSSADYPGLRSAGKSRRVDLFNFFNRLDGEGDYEIELALCESVVEDITYGGCSYSETDPYCDVFAIEYVTYEYPDLSDIVLTIAPIAGYESGVIDSYDEYTVVFPDVDKNELEGISASELYRRNVIGGYPDGTFQGENEVNRAEASKFLMLARYGLYDDDVSEDPFPDVDKDEWFAPYVERCADEGIINGYPDGYFRPADTVNTAEFLKMITLTFDLETDLSYTYTDVSEDDWFSEYAGIAQKYELFPGRDTELNPSAELTRYEVAVAIYQYFFSRDYDMTEGALLIRDMFSGLESDVCSNTDDPNKVSTCGDYAEEMKDLRDEFIEDFVGSYDVEDFYDGLVPMTLYVQTSIESVFNDYDVEVENSLQKNVTLYLAVGDKVDDFSELDSDFDMEDLSFDVLKVEAISYSYDGGEYYGPGYLAYEWSGAGYLDDGYYGMRLIDYAQNSPYSDYTDMFHILGSEFNKERDEDYVNPMGLLHYYVNTIHDFVDADGLEDGDVVTY